MFSIENKCKVAEQALFFLMGSSRRVFTLRTFFLHYLLVFPYVDEVMFASAASKLSVNKMNSFIRYLFKWMKKYERFPQVGQCPKAAYMLGLKLCKWVPKLDVTRCLGLVIDEKFYTLDMHSDLHEELKLIERVACGL